MPLEPQGDELDSTKSFRMLSPGASISHYKIVEKIGTGGMGEVYLAEDSKLKLTEKVVREASLSKNLR